MCGARAFICGDCGVHQIAFTRTLDGVAAVPWAATVETKEENDRMRLAALDVVLHCLSDRSDIVMGTDVANRNRGEVETVAEEDDT